MKMRVFPFLVGVIFVNGCAALGPSYHRPEISTPAAYRNRVAVDLADPARGPGSAPIEGWWKIFGDETLNQLECGAVAHHPRIEGAAAAVSAGRAALGIATADRLPSLGTSAQVQAAGESSEKTLPGSNTPYRSRGASYSIPFAASYELDLWGRVRRSTESAAALMEAGAADYRGVLLSLTADVAQYYFLLRALDHEALIVADTVRSRRDAAEIQASRYRSGMATELDLHRALVEAATLAADLADLNRQREQTADALAVASGIAPSVFAAPDDPTILASPPTVPAGLPAQLIVRRPDLAAAEATLHARTADIGVAEAERMPTITLTGTAGFNSADLRSLLSRPGQFWNIGAGLAAPIFDGDRLRFAADRARAQAMEAVATYREQALVALREVEDALIALRAEALQTAAQDEAQAEATLAAKIAKVRYDNGLANYLDVTDAERTLLQVKRSQAQLLAARYMSTVGLIRALGGAW